jgi:excisionase family DNA binding protein
MQERVTPQLLTVAQVSQRLEIHPETVRVMAREGRIPMFKITRGGDWRIELGDFEEWVKSVSGRSG